MAFDPGEVDDSVCVGAAADSQTETSSFSVTGTDATDLPLTSQTLGQWVVDVPVLKRLVTAEGFAFKQVSGISDKRIKELAKTDERTVFYQCASKSAFLQGLKKTYLTLAPSMLGLLYNGNNRNVLVADITKCAVTKWLTDSNECVVCYEQFDSASVKRQLIPCGNCSTSVCFGCFVDMFSAAETQEYQCPVCREEENHWVFFYKAFFILKKGRKSMEGMTESQLDFIAEMLKIDLREDWLTEAEWTEMHKLMLENWCRCGEALNKAQAFMRKRRKKAAATAGGRRAVDGCANCGKSFWDKSEWKCAPKCTKCKRVAYCGAKCRKKHKKAHAAECRPMAAKRKSKVKRK